MDSSVDGSGVVALDGDRDDRLLTKASVDRMGRCPLETSNETRPGATAILVENLDTKNLSISAYTDSVTRSGGCAVCSMPMKIGILSSVSFAEIVVGLDNLQLHLQ